MTLRRRGVILRTITTLTGTDPRNRAEGSISFSKAIDLLKLADFAASRHSGVTLEEIAEAFGVHHRTAQRMTQALHDAFPHAVSVEDGPDRRRRWRLREVPLARLRLTGADELEALEVAASRLRDEGDMRHARAIAALRDRLLAALPAPDARRAEADADAMLEAWGVAARPGPVVTVDPDLAEMVAAALRGPFRMRFTYSGERREVEPYGVLLGARRYLVARQPDKDTALRHFRLDRIEAPELTEFWFARDPEFDLQRHAARAFGSWQEEAQFGEVIWRFAPEAAERAAEWRFHPAQARDWLEDGRLEVRFRASGWLEMAWHLYQWGDAVEVVAPEPLRRMVAGWQRDDLEALP